MKGKKVLSLSMAALLAACAGWNPDIEKAQ